MTITISSAFDAGNIRVVAQDGDRIDLEIVKDHMSDFYQWFHFRLAGAGGREVTLRILNCGVGRLSRRLARLSRLPVDRPRGMGADRGHQLRRRRPDDPLHARRPTCVWLAYFAPYSMERHHDLVVDRRGAARRRLSQRSARASTARTSTA